MEKLQPVIRHHFWILFVIASIIPPVGWWMATGTLKAEADSRRTTLDNAFTSIPSGQNAPNQSWADGLQKLNDVRKETNRRAVLELWKNQQKLEIFTPNIAPYMVGVPYRGEIPDSKIRLTVSSLFRDDYEREVRRVWQIAEPVSDGRTKPDAGVAEKVVFPLELMPRVRKAKWDAFPPTSIEIWNASEDMWLLSELFSAIQRVNSVSSSVTDAYVKQIAEVKLFGGKRTDPASLSSAASGAGSQPGMMDSAMAGYGTGPMPFGPGGAAGRSSQALPAEFPISEEYEIPSSGTGPMAMMATGSEGMPSTASDSATSSTDAESDEYRYIARETAYRTRGFKLRLAVHQMRVAEVLRELMNSRYPVEITRFQFSAMNPDDPSGARNSQFGNSPAMAANPGYNIDTTSPGTFETAFAPPTDSTSTFDPGAFASGAEGFSATPMSSGMPGNAAMSLVAQAALKEVDLVDLVIVGEFYLYNPVEEAAAPSGGAPGSDSPAVEPAADSLTDTVPVSTTPGEPASAAGTSATSASGTPSEPSADGGNAAATTPLATVTSDAKPAETPSTVPAPDAGAVPAANPMPDGNAGSPSPAPPATPGSM